MRVFFFAQSREAAGCDEYQLEVAKPVAQAEFWRILVAELPKLTSFQKTARLARHETYLHIDELLNPDDEIAVIPPVSGG